MLNFPYPAPSLPYIQNSYSVPEQVAPGAAMSLWDIVFGIGEVQNQRTILLRELHFFTSARGLLLTWRW